MVARLFCPTHTFHTSPAAGQEPWSEILPEARNFDRLRKAFRTVCEPVGIETVELSPYLLGVRGDVFFPSLNSSLYCSPEVKVPMWVLAGAPKGKGKTADSALPDNMFAAGLGSAPPRVQEQDTNRGFLSPQGRKAPSSGQKELGGRSWINSWHRIAQP